VISKKLLEQVTKMDGINDIIKAQLPEQVGKVLRDRLERAEADAKDLAEARDTIANYEDIISDGSDQIMKLRAKLGEITKREGDVLEREVLLQDAERNLAIKELELKLAAQTTITNSYHQFTMGLVRNTEYRRTIAGGNMTEYPAQAADPMRGIHIQTPARTEVTAKTDITEAV
jgi:DNA gyrase/topoisomerase IV subunit A